MERRLSSRRPIHAYIQIFRGYSELFGGFTPIFSEMSLKYLHKVSREACVERRLSCRLFLWLKVEG